MLIRLRRRRLIERAALETASTWPCSASLARPEALLSEVKKKQRDSRSYIGYEDTVTEEMGDALWYLAVIANHAALPLFDPCAEARSSSAEPTDAAAGRCVRATPTAGTSGPTRSDRRIRTNASKAGGSRRSARRDVQEGLASHATALVSPNVWRRSLNSWSSPRTKLASLSKRRRFEISRRPSTAGQCRRSSDRSSTKNFPTEEQLPRSLTIDIFEREANNGKHLCRPTL